MAIINLMHPNSSNILKRLVITCKTMPLFSLIFEDIVITRKDVNMLWFIIIFGLLLWFIVIFQRVNKLKHRLSER